MTHAVDHARSRLSIGRKAVFSLGDHTVNLSLSALSLVFLYFLTDVAGLRPALAGLVIWIARAFDALSDPVMGRISDTTRSRWGRRRPYFLLGALPFGCFFALIWTTPVEGQMAMFVYYAATYMGLSLATTVLSVPYMSLLPEMARSYDERTSLNTFRSAGAVIGTVLAAGMKALADGLGGGPSGFATAGVIVGVWLVLPWVAVYRVSFERPVRATSSSVGAVEAIRSLARHRTYRMLCAIYILGRIAVDLAALAFVFFFTYWLRRESDFELALLALFATVLLSLPFWLRAARRIDKHRIFALGVAWWIACCCVMITVTPDWPRWSVLMLAALIGVGYAVADLMPWAMLGEVIDEGELLSGERLEGIYNGVFTFLRKLGGATAFLLAGLILDFTGYARGAEQPDAALWAIRILTTAAPAFFLLAALAVALHYPLGRERHREIAAQLADRERGQTA